MKHDSLRIDMHAKFGLGKKYCEKEKRLIYMHSKREMYKDSAHIKVCS